MTNLVTVTLTLILGSMTNLHASEQIRRQFIEYHITQPIDDVSVAKYVKELRPDGTWPDINYKSERRSGWDMVDHLSRLVTMATAYANPTSNYHDNTELKEKILKGLDHWIQKDYQNPNWFNGRIGVPLQFTTAFLLLGKDLPKPMLQQALRTVLNRTQIGMTGQNRVWCSGIVLMRGVLTNDKESIQKASQAIWSEVVVRSKEGIQSDWSFHQHGPQLQVGNYGLAYARDIVKWANVLRGTPYAPTKEKLVLLRNLLLESMAWYYWKGYQDLSACGRQVMKGCQAGSALIVAKTMKLMIKVDPQNAKRYDLDTYPLHGFKGYWRSDVAVARRPEWYASIRMVSTRTIGAEACNSENMHGLHQADGVLLHYQSGREYEDIQPLWDWRRLPGTTCDQGLKKLKPGGRGKSSFAGIVEDGKNGVAAMIYKRDELSAQKAWFIFDDRIVCLGAGIRGLSREAVYTSVEQRWFASKVLTSEGTLTKGTKSIKANGWVYHQGVGYRMMNGALVSNQTVKGSWKSIFPTRPEESAKGDVFSIWIDHGKSPSGATYAYTLFPKIAENEMDTPAVTILSNTESVQAVTLNGDLSAVFYTPGEIICNGTLLRVDKPCLLMRRKGRLFVTDPTQKQTSITVTQGEISKTIQLPSGQMAGSTAVVRN